MEEVNNIMNNLSIKLKNELKKEIHFITYDIFCIFRLIVFKNYINKFEFFTKYFSPECLDLLYDNIEEKLYSPGEMIKDNISDFEVKILH